MSKSFKSGYNRGSNTQRTFEDKVLLFKDGVSHTWLQNYLSDGKTTRFRILPSFSDGEEDIALNPEGEEDTSMFDLFGGVSAVLEIASGIGERRYTYASGGFTDNSGNTVSDSWSVTRSLLNRLKFKLRDTLLCEEHGRKDLVDIPPSWRRWLADPFQKFRLHEPVPYVCFQVMAAEINGNQVEDSRGNKTWGGPYLFAVRRSAMDQFLQDVRTRVDPASDLSLANNLFGDFCSLESGHIIMLRKIRKEDGRGNNQAYNLKPVGGPFPLEKAYVESKFTPWDDLISVPTIEEAVELFAQTFDGMAVDFALRDSGSYSEYIPQDYRGMADGISNPMKKADRVTMLGLQVDENGKVQRKDNGGDDLDMGDAPVIPAMPAEAAPPAPPAPDAAPKKQFKPGTNVSGTNVQLEAAEDEEAFKAALADARAGQGA